MKDYLFLALPSVVASWLPHDDRHSSAILFLLCYTLIKNSETMSRNEPENGFGHLIEKLTKLKL